jgi:3D (Asp-Asp-Asp) domain-containing protein
VRNTSRNFVFLTLALTILTSLQYPQIQKAQNLIPEVSALNTSAFTSNQTLSQPTKNESSIEQPINNSNETPTVSEAPEANIEVAASAARAFTATAYALKGRTASGSGVRRGIIAADPRVLPLGTRVQLTAGTWSGTYTVADTGGKIKGNKIDIWVPSNSEAIRFGRRTVHVAVLGKK